LLPLAGCLRDFDYDGGPNGTFGSHSTASPNSTGASSGGTGARRYRGNSTTLKRRRPNSTAAGRLRPNSTSARPSPNTTSP